MKFDSNSVDVPRVESGHILLISAPLFSYHNLIAETMRSLGYRVTWWDDRASASVLYKILLRLSPMMVSRYSESFFLKRLDSTNLDGITNVLVIKGEALSRRVICKIRERFPLASMGLYLWDGVSNVKGALKIFQEFDSVATFDPEDAKKYLWTYRPLFSTSNFKKLKTLTDINIDLCFIGTIHSDRYRVIYRICKKYESSLRIFIFAYFPSLVLLIIRKIFDWTLFFAPNKRLKLKPMSGSEVMQVLERSLAVLDIEHPKQRGLTMRTIETLLAQKKLITTNKYIVNCNLYHHSRVLVIDRKNPNIKSEFLESPFLPIHDTELEYYSCEGWVRELLFLQNAAKKIAMNHQDNI